MITSCQPSNQSENKREKKRIFHTTAPSLLYFKNVRSSYYKMEEQPKSRIELYQHARFQEASDRPIIYPVIANNWLEDEAYLFLKKNDYRQGFTKPLTVRMGINSSAEIYELSPASIDNQYELSLRIYESLKEGNTLQVKDADGQWQLLFDQKSDRQYYNATLRDFLKLTEAI